MEQETTQAHGRLPLKIAAFPKGPDLWRIDWFGSIAFPDRMARRMQPSVLVHLSKVVAADALTNPSVLLSSQAMQPAEWQTKRWVSVGTTMLLNIGDLWQDQALVATPEYETEIFTDVEVGRETAQMVKAGSSLDEDGAFLLPLVEHPWHRGNTHSYCLRLTLPDGRYLVVPCMELVRFYFGSSSELLSRLFMPPFSRDRLYSRVAWDVSRGRLSLDLAEKLPRASAADVARIAGDDVAWRAASLVPNSCLRASVSGKEIYPQAAFPFEGKTTLVVTGKWLSRGDEQRATFLAYQLRSCSHPFPFKALQYTVQGVRRKAPQRSTLPDEVQAEDNPQRPRTSKNPTDPILQEQDASSTLSGKQHTVSARREFLDLRFKPVWASKKIADSSLPIANQTPAINDLAVGDMGSAKRVRQIALVEALNIVDKAPVPPYLQCVVEAIKDLEGIRVELMTASHEDGWTLPLNLLPDQDGVIEDAHFTHASGDIRPRRVAVFKICAGDLCAVLCVVEADQLVPMLYPVEREAMDGPWDALQRASATFITAAGLLAKDRRGFGVEWRSGRATPRLKKWIVSAMKRLD